MKKGIFVLLAAGNAVYAGSPVWTFTPLTATNISVSNTGSAVVRYTVTNQSRKSHTLVMNSIPGITQDTSSGNCPNPFTLAYQQSCHLTLNIIGSQLTGNINGGPVVCEQASQGLQCYQPSTANQLAVTLSASSQYSVGGNISGLTGSLYLENNNTNTQLFNANGPYSFTNQLNNGQAYNVTVASQPSGQVCTVTNGTGTINGSNVTNANVNCSTNAYTVGGTVSGLNGTVVLLNNGTDNKSIAANGGFTFNTPVAQGAPYNVTVGTQPSGQTCTVTNGSGTMGSANVTNVGVSCVTSASTTLSTSVSTLALSVNKTSTNPALTGIARQITITNTGGSTATGLNINYPNWPALTTASSNCGSTLSAGASCVITITPGPNATSNCDAAYTAPQIPGPDTTITVIASNVTTPATSNVVVLSYGCQYQDGFLYAVNDSTANTGSIGGKVVSLVDQAPPRISSGAQVGSIIWSSNGVAGNANYSYDRIPFISDIAGSPSYSDAQLSFNSIYANTSTYPFPPLISFTSCNGLIDGKCNSTNIITLYDLYRTNFGVGSLPYTLALGQTNRDYYAAGKCTGTIGNYSNWYLPAICEMSVLCSSETQNMETTLPLLIGNPAAATPSTSCNPPSDTSCLAGYYWSSTESSSDSVQRAYIWSFDSSSSNYGINRKDTLRGVRCSRALTY